MQKLPARRVCKTGNKDSGSPTGAEISGWWLRCDSIGPHSKTPRPLRVSVRSQLLLGIRCTKDMLLGSGAGGEEGTPPETSRLIKCGEIGGGEFSGAPCGRVTRVECGPGDHWLLGVLCTPQKGTAGVSTPLTWRATPGAVFGDGERTVA